MITNILSLPGGHARYCGNIGFLLHLHRDIDQLRIEIEVKSVYDIFSNIIMKL